MCDLRDRMFAKEGFGGIVSAWHSISQAEYNRNLPTNGDGGTQV